MLPDLSEELEFLKSCNLYRSLRPIESPQDSHIHIHGQDLLLLCSNNYLGLANHFKLKKAAIDAIHTYGCSTTASRLISGSTSLHRDLESRFAQFFGTESSLTFPTGYMANLGAITALVGQPDTIFSDQLNHRSIIDACRLSQAKTIVYRHRDTGHLNALLRAETGRRRRLIITDGLFSMDGDFAPLPDLVDLARIHNAILMVDDAHGTGVLGPTGRGTPEYFGVATEIDVLMTSGSKALGAYGGFIAGSKNLIDLLINRSPSFIYTTALPPDACAATLAALKLIESQPTLRKRLWSNVQTVRKGLLDLGFDLMGSQAQIIPVRIGNPNRTLAISDFLYKKGMFLYGIRPPTVPEGESRLRLSLMSSHNTEDITRILKAFKEIQSIYFS